MFANDPVNFFSEMRQEVVLRARKEPSTKPVKIEIAEVT